MTTSIDDVHRYLTSTHESARVCAINFALYAARVWTLTEDTFRGNEADMAASYLARACAGDPALRDAMAAALEYGPAALADAFAASVSKADTDPS